MNRRRQVDLVTRRWLAPRTLVYFYRRRLRRQWPQELFAGLGIASAVALVLASGVAQSSIAGSTREVVRAVTGPASLELRARGPKGFSETLLPKVEALAGVQEAAPLLDRTMLLRGPHGHGVETYVAGTDLSLGVLNGLGKTLPANALEEGVIAVSALTGGELGLRAKGSANILTLYANGLARKLRVSAVLGPEAIGVLAHARVAVMQLASLQRLLGQTGRLTRILVRPAPGARARVAGELRRLAGPRLLVGGTDKEVKLLEQALKPSRQASTLFALIVALLGFLLAFNAIMLTVTERRRAIADLRLAGTTRSAIVQMQMFQALALGAAASVAGLAAGYVLSRWIFHQSIGYLQEAFTIGGSTALDSRNFLIAGAGGVLATLIASAVPLLDLRRGRTLDAVYLRDGARGSALSSGSSLALFIVALVLFGIAGVLYFTSPSAALATSAALALALVLALPVWFAAVVGAARKLSERAPRMATLVLAVGGVRGTTVRSLALAATGAVALFGCVALGGARSNLLHGIDAFAHAYAADAPVWVGEPGDNQATGSLARSDAARTLRRLPGVGSVSSFQGAFLTVGTRQVWVLARPPGGARNVLARETVGGPAAGRRAARRIATGGWVAVSEGLAGDLDVREGGTIELPTPSGPRRFRVAALTTNLAWVPGVVLMSTVDFARAWETTQPSAFAVRPAPGVGVQRLESTLNASLGPDSGLQVVGARERERRIERLTSEGLSQLGLTSTMLLLAAILALSAALASSINQRRTSLASFRLAGATPRRLRSVLALEAMLMLGAGCVAGTLAGILGQLAIDQYLRHVTGFPVASAGADLRPLSILGLVLATSLALVAVPAWIASRVSPTVALTEE